MRVLLFTPTPGSLLEGVVDRYGEVITASTAGEALAQWAATRAPLVLVDAEVDPAQAETFLRACPESVRVALVYPDRARGLVHHPAVRYSLLAPAPWKEICEFVIRCTTSAARAVAARSYYQRKRIVPKVVIADDMSGMKTSPP